jgi:hypothetical protein
VTVPCRAAYENIVGNSALCPEMNDALQAALNSSNMGALASKYSAVLAAVEPLVGRPLPFTHASLGPLHDCLMTHACNGLPVPDGMNDSLFTAANGAVSSRHACVWLVLSLSLSLPLPLLRLCPLLVISMKSTAF